jgi:hypothetical protein
MVAKQTTETPCQHMVKGHLARRRDVDSPNDWRFAASPVPRLRVGLLLAPPQLLFC